MTVCLHITIQSGPQVQRTPRGVHTRPLVPDVPSVARAARRLGAADAEEAATCDEACVRACGHATCGSACPRLSACPHMPHGHAETGALAHRRAYGGAEVRKSADLNWTRLAGPAREREMAERRLAGAINDIGRKKRGRAFDTHQSAPRRGISGCPVGTGAGWARRFFIIKPQSRAPHRAVAPTRTAQETP